MNNLRFLEKLGAARAGIVDAGIDAVDGVDDGVDDAVDNGLGELAMTLYDMEPVAPSASTSAALRNRPEWLRLEASSSQSWKLSSEVTKTADGCLFEVARCTREVGTLSAQIERPNDYPGDEAPWIAEAREERAEKLQGKRRAEARFKELVRWIEMYGQELELTYEGPATAVTDPYSGVTRTQKRRRPICDRDSLIAAVAARRAWIAERKTEDAAGR